MEQSVDEMKRLLERWFEAQATDAEEQVLREFFRRGDVPQELRYAQAMFGGLEAMAAETAPKPSGGRQKGRVKHWVLWAAPLAAAVAVGIFLLAGYLRQPYCYINGVAVYDADEAMAATVCLERLGEFDRPVQMFDEMLNKK